MLVGLLSVVFVALPLVPHAYALVAVPVGVAVWWRARKRPALLVPVVAFALLGSLAHVLAVHASQRGGALPETVFHSLLTSGAVESGNHTHVRDNLLSQAAIAGLRAWNRVDGGNSDARLNHDGFWTVPRINAATGRENVAIYVFDRVRVVSHHPYTLSFYFRHDGAQATFDIVFRTHSRVVRVPANIEEVGQGLHRAYATFEAREGDIEMLRLLEIEGFEGDWSIVSIGLVKLERGDAPTPFSANSSDSAPNPWRGSVWWFSTALLVLFLAHGSGYLIGLLPKHVLGLALSIGLIAHVAIATIEVSGLLALRPDVAETLSRLGVTGATRASGLAGHPNILGPMLLANAMLIWVVAGWRLSLAAAGAALAGVLFSGSRTAFFGWFLMCVTWLVGLRRASLRLTSLAAVVAFTVFVLLAPQHFGRVASALNLGDQNISQRLEAWGVLGGAFLASPAFGIGSHQTEAYINLERIDRANLAHVSHAHNVFLHAATEAGLLGLGAVLILLGSLARGALGCQHRRGAYMLVVCLAVNMTDLTLFAPGVLYPLLVAIASCTEHKLTEQTADTPRPR